jgi:integrase
MSSTGQKRTYGRYPGVFYRIDSKGRRRYGIDYYDSNRQRVIKTLPLGTNEKDARRERASILERMHRGEKVVKSNITVSDLIQRYLDTQVSHLKDKTRDGYEYNLNHWVIPRIGNIKVAELGVGHISQFIVDMRKHGFKKWTIQGCLTPMGSMFRYAVRQGWMSKNPISELERNERPRADQRQMEILSTDDIQLVLQHAKKQYRPIIHAACWTGMRIGELLSLQWDDVDLENGIIRVRSSKTRAGVREVVIPDSLVRVLASLDTTSGYVFQTKRGTPFGQRNVLRALHEAQEDAGLTKTGLHALRHTYASMMIAQGVDVVQVSKQLGHANPKITLGIYAHLFEGDKRKKEMRMKMNELAVGFGA